MSPKLRRDLDQRYGSHGAPDEAPARSHKRLITLQDRLESGNLSVRETYELAGGSRTKFYTDLKAGRVIIIKMGRRSLVPGPVAKRYAAGEPIGA